MQHLIDSFRRVSKPVDPATLIGTTEVAERLEVSVQTVHSWIRRYDDFPLPATRVGRSYLWHWPDVEAWARATGRLNE